MRTILQVAFGGERSRYLNIYVGLDGCYHPLPFDAKREGLWYFDGQVFYQKKGIL